MKKFATAAVCLVVFFTVAIVLGCSIYNYKIGPVSKNETLKEVVVEKGETYYTLASKLEEQNLIRSDTFFKLYVKLMKPKALVAGKYTLSENMGVKKIVSVLENGSGYEEGITITFHEGLPMWTTAKTIAQNSNNTEEEVFNLLQDESYIDELIENYWFLTEDIKNTDLYYPLEGYLFPNTYEFKKEASVRDIFKVMLDEMAKQLEPLRQDIVDSGQSIHELLSMASMVEAEAITPEDRELVASVFYNRIKSGITLGSDVTTYYAAKLNMGDRDLTMAELNSANPYNTRGSHLGLPVGPINNPSLMSIKAALHPQNSDYYYFVADKNRKVHFTRTNAEHEAKIRELRAAGLWYEFE